MHMKANGSWPSSWRHAAPFDIKGYAMKRYAQLAPAAGR